MRKQYIIDTNSLFMLKFYPRDKFKLFEKFWSALERAFNKKIVVFPKEVLLETRSRPEIEEFLRNHPNALIDNEDVYIKLSQVLERFPNMAYKKRGNKPQRQKYHADPHIISLALVLKEVQRSSIIPFFDDDTDYEVVIVTEEKNKENKIPWYAEKYGIRCITFLDLMRELGVE